jgi:hypothetical protein
MTKPKLTLFISAPSHQIKCVLRQHKSTVFCRENLFALDPSELVLSIFGVGELDQSWLA